ncbi:epithelial cell adhesion molecule-like [Eleutherodactylus coqui]|uniref:epithelial cell adhesion molecule-like n=1 Tax=Eleutherodactylus coqui TaxID=57060 RepID=UPI003463441E
MLKSFPIKWNPQKAVLQLWGFLLLFGSRSGVFSVPDDEYPDTLSTHENCDHDEVCEDSSCQYNEYVTCRLNRCGTSVVLFSGYDNLIVDCNQYNTGCEECGAFKAKQCDKVPICPWCVNSGGVRVTDKTNDGLKCGKLVSVYREKNRSMFYFATASARTASIEVNGGHLTRSPSAINMYIYNDWRFCRSVFCLIQVCLTFKADVPMLKGKEEALCSKIAFFSMLSLVGLGSEGESMQVLVFDNKPPQINMKSIAPGFNAIIALAIIIYAAVSYVVVLQRQAEQECTQFKVIQNVAFYNCFTCVPNIWVIVVKLNVQESDLMIVWSLGMVWSWENTK